MMFADEEAGFATIGEWKDYDAYQGALVLPVDPQGRVLLQLRDHDASIHPGEWGLFGGGVERGETIRGAAVREMGEELGVSVAPEALRPFARLVAPGSRARLYLFEAALDIGPRDIRLGEGAGFGFIEPRDFASLRLLAAARIFLTTWRRARRGS